MQRIRWFALAVLLAAPAWAEEQTKVEQGTSTTHSSACDLADAMAAKLGIRKDVSRDQAQQTCKMLVPSSMNESDHAEFIRCCLKHLLGGDAAGAPAAKPKSEKAPGI
ncbi:MAG TPA: hypothetical protein VMW17_22050 [Candidatus Binatia bacterium]|nr:hypothetical protein [Candidatus Binatia bacterium]